MNSLCLTVCVVELHTMIVTMCVNAIHKFLGWHFSLHSWNDRGMSHGVFFGSNVREARELAGWTRADFLRRLESSGVPMHATTLARIEEGKQVAKIPEALAMASLLGTTVEVLGNMDNFALQEEIKAAELAVMKKKGAVLNAWEEWIIAGEELLDTLLKNGYRLNEFDQDDVTDNYTELTGLNEMLRDLAARDYGTHYEEKWGDSYVDEFQKFRNEASLGGREQEDQIRNDADLPRSGEEEHS